MKFVNQRVYFYNDEKNNLTLDEEIILEKSECKDAIEDPWEFVFGNLVTTQYNSPGDRSRGLHYSAAGEEFTVPVWGGWGWVDAGYKFLLNLSKSQEITDLIERKKQPNLWTKKEE